ncbi:MAG: N-6 DNA methylase [Flavobacteriaceae bacterium]|nr:N-6 DNA methylase [Flavobacteriaceae bacterium]
MDFKPLGNAHFVKRYEKTKCEIRVDLNNKKIFFPEKMEVVDQTTSNFSKDENFVVLECVNRLLSKGYFPENIKLEKKWRVGHKHKGKLDILIQEKNSDKSYLMIECKTHPEEYENEKEKMLKNGGQLFSYWVQDRNANYLCLYSSYIENNTIKNAYSMVEIEDAFRDLGTLNEVHNRWNKQFLTKGLIDDGVNPYDIGGASLMRNDLEPLKESDGKRIYHQFLEILRHNIVSDKGNAFNKIFNLFLCKIVDEEKSSDEKLEFQWFEGEDNYESILGRLNSLYKHGMDKYLNKDVTDYTVEDIVKSDLLDFEAKQKITELRLYKNQEFAFVEVYNKNSFEQNAKIVIQIVKLLQKWQIRYTHKQQFLGEFFELLLNTGFKQESGQYFTPVPLVQFIINCLPIEDLIQRKIDSNETYFLPYVIDFACGSGHFLTELMDVLESYIQKIPPTNLRQSQLKKLNGYKADTFGWAKDYIYGIEYDYRLAKTSKLACFLNGDGEARIIHASGIESFQSENYFGKLKSHDLMNNNFDILIANPPYAVKGFKSNVVNDNSFLLLDKIRDKSDNIEVLFVERMSQLLKPNGVVGIILPLSLFTGGKIYEDARRIIFENFKTKGFVLLESQAFMSTDIKTVVLFLKKRSNRVELVTKQNYFEIFKNQKVVIAYSGTKEIEKSFLGYEFSSRRGSEGIKIRKESRIFDKANPSSDKHINSYFLANMLGKEIPDLHPKLSEHLKIRNMDELFNWDEENFSNAIYFKNYKLEYSNDIGELIPIKSIIDVIESGKRPKGGISEISSGALSLGGEHIIKDICELKEENMKYVPKEYFQNMNKGKVVKGDILINKDGAQTGKTALFLNETTDNHVSINEHLFLIRSKDEKVCQKYLFYFMVSDFFQKQVIVYAHQKGAQPGLNLDHFERMNFLYVDKKRQHSVVESIDIIWSDETKKEFRKQRVNEIFTNLGLSGKDL